MNAVGGWGSAYAIVLVLFILLAIVYGGYRYY